MIIFNPVLLLLAFLSLRIGRGQNTCRPEDDAAACVIDGFVGTKVIYEDAQVKVWNFTLAPGETTSMHRHDCSYHFVAIQPTELEVYGASGARLFSFQAQGTLGFSIEGEELVQDAPVGSDESFRPIRVPRIHAARNIGAANYYEILFESKTKCV